MTRTEADRIADLRDLTDDGRYALLAWLVRNHPDVFDSGLARRVTRGSGSDWRDDG